MSEIIFCLDVGDSITHRSSEFMDIWKLIEFYHSFGYGSLKFYLEYENG